MPRRSAQVSANSSEVAVGHVQAEDADAHEQVRLVERVAPREHPGNTQVGAVAARLKAVHRSSSFIGVAMVPRNLGG